jgi:hypothetical protein
MLVINYTWDLPRASRTWNTPVVRALLDGWQLAGITAFASGYPLTPSFSTTDGQDIWGGGDPGWVVRTGDPNLPRGERTSNQWFDTSIFRRPTSETFGTPSRNVIQGPGYSNWDLSVFKNVPLGGRRILQLRIEAFNAFNHTQWSSVNVSANFDPTGAQWRLLARGTTIGHRKLDRFPSAPVQRVRVIVEDAVAPPQPLHVGLYAHEDR